MYLAFFLGTSMFSSLLSLPFCELVVEPFKVPTESMEPALIAGDQFFVLKRVLPISRGDVVVYRRTEAFVKRVVAVAGDTVQLRSGVLFINGAEHGGRRTYRVRSRIIAGATPDIDLTTVPKRHLFVLGDNRGSSVVSRVHGPVAIADVIGRPRWCSSRSGPPRRAHAESQARLTRLNQISCPCGPPHGRAPDCDDGVVSSASVEHASGMLVPDSDDADRLGAELDKLQRSFPRAHRDIAALRVNPETDHLGRPAFFAVMNLRRNLEWRSEFLIKVELTRALARIDPSRAVFVGSALPNPTRRRKQ